MPYSYNGWPASPFPSAIGIVPFAPIRGHGGFPAGVKSGDVKVVFTYLVLALDKRVEAIEEYAPGDEWGYSYRRNTNNPSQLSCHASGTAVDYNATQHPNHVDYTWTRAQVREIHQIVNEELDGVIKWLEGWDEMHFEIRGTTLAVKRVADKIRAGVKPPPPPNKPPVIKPKGPDMTYFQVGKADGSGYFYRCCRPWTPHMVSISSSEYEQAKFAGGYCIGPISEALYAKFSSGWQS